MSDGQKSQTLDIVEQSQQECLACRIIGSGALAATGAYALNMSRAHHPGSIMGKRVMGALGVGFLVGSVLRWTKS
ncbi:hypothetical protein NEOLEDRAFT_1062170 [Neolentinus lepideus HHB14362 ss-1]|uniref:Distal membrane-arm assembly complex protein 1-like domain-containing protein n=1 Tax=Neolentinus lepideus HHB14362 ss-1 TaxID=1314782 RepID=A0A165TKL8_9AGAM|nr:hypothetical protein NEOLEDRAFT_1062170 [Neolentinus lepideus HHB14362 ss-1]